MILKRALQIGFLAVLCLHMVLQSHSKVLAAEVSHIGSVSFVPDALCPISPASPSVEDVSHSSSTSLSDDLSSSLPIRPSVPAGTMVAVKAVPGAAVLASSVQRICKDCTHVEKKILNELLATRGRVVDQNTDYVGLDCGVAVHKNCLKVFGDRLPVLIQQALVCGIRCLGATPTKTTTVLIGEMLQVLGRVRAPKPVILCRSLTSDNMKAVGIRSEDRKKSPVIVLSPVLAKESEEYIESVIFHEFLHLGGNGHPHGAQRELATPCQGCCFGGRPFGDVAKPYACTVCTSDYADKYDEAYLHDLGEWAKRTPGSEFIFRINMMDGVKRAGGDVGFLVELVETFRDHPFGFELARMVSERYPLQGTAAERVGAVARKLHGHVTKRYIPFAQAVAEATIRRFDGARKGDDAEGTIESVSNVLLSSSLPGKGDVPRLDLPIFYKYYYEFAMLRGVLADEVYSMWNARWKDTCAQNDNVPVQPVASASLNASGIPSDEGRALCEDLTHKRDVFACQKMGLDYNPESHSCQK